jgi:photosystem II stability/assembly factor-like uncharacterized protein
MRKIYCFVLLIFIPAFYGFNQPWMKNISNLKSLDDSASFINIRKAFNDYWKDRVVEKGHGFNPFRRWEWFMEQRIWGEWKIPNHILWQESEKKQQLRKTKSSEGNWSLIGPVESSRYIDTDEVLGSGRIDCIAFHPTDTNIIWVGSPTGGLWKTKDGGTTWYTTTDSLPSLGISDIVLDPDNPDIIYLATGDRDANAIYSAGILKSTDGGETWDTTGLSFSQSDNNLVNRLLINPDNTNVLIAAMRDGIYYSNNSGNSWEKKTTGTKHFKDLEFKPGNPSIVYAASYVYGGNAKIYKSTDGGFVFNESSSGIATYKTDRIELAVTPSNPSIVYALSSSADDGGLNTIFKSMDSGSSWEQTMSTYKNLLANDPDGNNDGGQGWYDLSLAASSVDANEIYVGGINIWKSTDAGKNWSLKTNGYPRIFGSEYGPYVHVDHHILKYHPVTGTFFSGHDGGINKSYDGGKTWIDITNGLEILQIYRIGASATKRDLVLMGSQDNSTIQYKSGDWKVVLGGDGMECIVDYTDTNTIYSSYQYGNIFYSNDGGINIYNITPEGAGEGAWITPYIMHPWYPNIIYAGLKNIYKSINHGFTWDSIASSISGDVLFRSIAISPSNPDYIYAATMFQMWRTSDGGNSWVSIESGLPYLTITYIAVSQYDPNKIWITLSGYTSDKKVFTSDDGGATWENYSNGLPNVPVNCIVYENNSNMGVYAATDLGVYYRNKSMDEWIDFSKKLPNIIVNELEIYYPDSMLRAGTYGRGLWESELYTHPTPPLFAEFTAENNSVCQGSNITFNNLSSSDFDSLNWDFGQDATPPSSTDTIVDVSYSSAGDKTISLIVYKDGDSDIITKHNYINVIDEFDLSLSTSIVSQVNLEYPPTSLNGLKKGDKVIIEAKGASVYSWSPVVGLDTTSGPVVIASPLEPGKYKYIVTANQDNNCYDIDSVQFIINAPPTNDNVCDAIELAFGTNGPFDNKYATVQQNEPLPETTGINACYDPLKWCEEGGLQNSVWFKFTGPASNVISIDTEGMDNQIAVYDSPSCDSILSGVYTLLAANDDYHDENENYASAIAEITGLTEGKTYWVQIDGSAGGVEGTFNLIYWDSPLSAFLPASDITGHNLVNIYPNPNEGTFDLSLNLDEPQNILLKVFNINGQLVYSEYVEKITRNEVRNINLNNPARGLYILKLLFDHTVITRKVMIE